MKKYDKFRIENAIWTLLHHEYDLEQMHVTDRYTYEIKEALEVLKDIHWELYCNDDEEE